MSSVMEIKQLLEETLRFRGVRNYVSITNNIVNSLAKHDGDLNITMANMQEHCKKIKDGTNTVVFSDGASLTIYTG